MPLVTTKEMFEKAYNGGYAVGAFNVNNMEIVQGITEAAGELKSPVILQVSKGARAYANHTYLVKLVEAAIEENDPDFLTVALGDVAKAEGMTKVARKAKVTRENLYRALSPGGNPTIATVMRVLDALGLRICVSPAMA